MALIKNKIIFSVELSTLSEFQNNIRTRSLEITLKNLEISFKKVTGSYKGVKETSFIIDAKHIDTALTVMGLYNQESILVLNNKGEASLKFNNNMEQSLNGTMQKVNGELPEAWTLIDNEFFTIAA